MVGIYFFRVNDPWHFDSVAKACTTLFRTATLEDYSTVMCVVGFFLACRVLCVCVIVCV